MLQYSKHDLENTSTSCNWMHAVQRDLSLPRVRQKLSPLVSVVTPSYNQARYIESTMLSVLNQDYDSIEYIIIDGGSSDGTKEILKRYAHSLAYWVSEPDNGQTHAINKGLQKAKGEILAYLNSDDVYWTNNVIGRVVTLFNQNPSVDFVYGDSCILNAENKYVRPIRHPGFDKQRLFSDARYFISQPSVFFRKRVIDNIGLFDESFHFKMDREFYIRAVKSSAFLYCPELFSGFRTHAEAKSNPNNARLCRNEWHRIQAKHGIPRNIKSELYYLLNHIYANIPKAIRHSTRKCIGSGASKL